MAQHSFREWLDTIADRHPLLEAEAIALGILLATLGMCAAR
ncbi:MAG: hypothetical protein ACYC3Q_01245 [Gemmatimonadaceae bacterium]